MKTGFSAGDMREYQWAGLRSGRNAIQWVSGLCSCSAKICWLDGGDVCCLRTSRHERFYLLFECQCSFVFFVAQAYSRFYVEWTQTRGSVY